MRNIMQGSVIRLVNGFSEVLVAHKRIIGIGVMVLNMHVTDIMLSTQQTGAGSIGRELINRIPNDDARKALFPNRRQIPRL